MVDEEKVQEMVARFLRWPLPKSFAPDGGVTFMPTKAQRDGTHPWPVGTNLLDYNQAEEMVRFMLDTDKG